MCTQHRGYRHRGYSSSKADQNPRAPSPTAKEGSNTNGFRPERKAQDAVVQIKENLKQGFNEVCDADLSSYFDTVDHKKLMIIMKQRIADRSVLKLIRLWLNSPIEENQDGNKIISKPTRGAHQRGGSSPLLGNVYLNYFDTIFNKDRTSPKFTNGAEIIRYVDDFVIMAKCMSEEITNWIQERIEDRLDLNINKDKTKILRVAPHQDEINFLGFTFKYLKDLQGSSWHYLYIMPSKKAIDSLKEKIWNITKKGICQPTTEVIAEISKVTDWMVQLLQHRISRKGTQGYKLLSADSV